MKRLGFMLLIVASGSLFAQEGTSWLELQGSAMVPHATSIKKGAGFGLGGGTWLTDRWGLELSGLTWKLKSNKAPFLADGTETSEFLSALFNFSPGNKSITPYGFLGVGASQVDAPWSFKTSSANVLNLSAGLGLQAPLGDHFMVSREGRARRVNVTNPHSEGILTLGLAALEIVLDEGQRRDWFGSNLIIVSAVVAAVCLVGVVFYLLKKDHPILDLRLLKDRNFAVAALMLFILGFVLYGSMALLPIFLQTLLGYTATLSGRILSPGGMVILVMMPVVAMLLRKFDTRLLIGSGFLFCGLGLFWMAQFNLQVDFQTIMIARMVQCLGLAFLFVPMNVTAFMNVPPDKTSYASGMLNLVRNIGGSTGIALVSTILSRRSQVHQASLVGNLHPGSLAYQGFLGRAGQMLVHQGASPTDAARQAQGLAYGTLQRHSAMMGFTDTFWIMAVLCLALLPMIFLMRATHAGRGPMPVE